MLFTERSLWTMVHGIGFGGAAMLALTAALFAMYLMHSADGRDTASELYAQRVARLTAGAATLLWLTSLVGTYVVFPPYRASPPEGVMDLTEYPRSFLLSDPGSAWLHAFGMETKEHLPWIATMLATAVAFSAWRYGAAIFRDRNLRQMATGLLAVCFVIVAYVSLLGIFINKVAPVQ